MIFLDYLKFILHVNTFFGSPATNSRSFFVPDGTWLCAMSIENEYGTNKNVRYAKLSNIYSIGTGNVYSFIDNTHIFSPPTADKNSITAGPLIFIGNRTVTAEAQIFGDCGMDFMFHFFKLPRINAI